METYRKINQWTSHSRDMVESFKRYYNNSFLDGQRQEAYNLFLGNYIFAQGQPMLWDLATDYYLHHADPRAWSNKIRRSYINWYTPSFLEKRKLPKYVDPLGVTANKPLGYFDDYWLEYYKPLAVSSLLKIFSYMGKMNSTLRYIPFRSTQEGRYDLSPFKVRTEADQDVPDKKRAKKGVTIVDPSEEQQPPEEDDALSIKSGTTITTKRISIQRWLQPIHEKEKVDSAGNGGIQGIMKEGAEREQVKQKLTPLDKSKAAQWTFTQVVNESLNPSVSAQEQDDYSRYVSHPQTLPLVVSTELPTEINNEYLEYVNGSWKDIGIVTGMDFGAGMVEDGKAVSVGAGMGIAESDLAEYREFLTVAENPLTVMEEDGVKKRYKAYRKWLLGKSLFKQQPID
jgi:hypothetical protein